MATTAPAATDGVPTGTTDQPGLLGLLAWARRQIKENLFNEAPTATFTQLSQDPYTGVVTGKITATDPEGDPVSFQVRDSPYGTTEIKPDGTVIFTPTAEYAAEGGADLLSIAVSDPANRLNLLRLFDPDAHTTDMQAKVGIVGLQSGLGFTRSFFVYNLTSIPLTYKGTATGNVESFPPINSVLKPGERASFEVTYYFGETNNAKVGFAVGNDALSTYYPKFTVTAFEGKLRAGCDTGRGTCTTEDNRTVVMQDAAGTVIVVGGTDAQQQRDVLNSLCYDGSRASCTFKVDRQIETTTPGHLVGREIKNTDAEPVVYTRRYTDTVTQTDSVMVTGKAAVKIGAMVDLEISATYGHTWTSTQTFSEEITTTTPPGYRTWIQAEDPIYRVYGDFTLKMGNTTYILKDVYFDTPNPNAQGVWTVHEKPLTAVRTTD